MRTVLRTVDEGRVDWTQWISLVPLVMHTVATYAAPNAPGLKKQEIAMAALRSIVSHNKGIRKHVQRN